MTADLKKRLYSILLFIPFAVNAQKVETTLKKLSTDYPQEKLFLHFDQTNYNPGETVWFKAYLFTGNFPSEISKTVFAELVNKKGEVLQRVSMPVYMSGASGSFTLPATGDDIFVRAYTKWMLNFDSAFVYSKQIQLNKKQVEADVNKRSVLFHVFPEGGDLVEGLESEVAFKITDNYGRPVSANGHIEDSKKNTITEFGTLHDGMGVFSLVPVAGEIYKAVCKSGDQTIETILPQPKNKGVVMKVRNAGNAVYVNTAVTDANAIPFVYVVAQMNQRLLFKAKAVIKNDNAVTAKIPVEKFNAGIMQVTVFDANEKPLAERIVFINPTEAKLNPVIALQGDTAKRSKNTVSVQLPDTLFTSLSVSVVDEDLSAEDEHQDIYSHLLLTSDIKGYVHDPAYYFSSAPDTKRDLDLLMMTNGWRRFNWESALAGNFPAINFPADKYILVQGDVNRGDKAAAGKDLSGVMEFRNRPKAFFTVTVNNKGKFELADLVFYDTAKMYMQLNNDPKQKLAPKFDLALTSETLTKPVFKFAEPAITTGSSTNEAVLEKNQTVFRKQQALDNFLKKGMTLEEVKVSTARKTKMELMDKEYTTGMFSSAGVSDTRVILPEDDPAFLSSENILTYLESRFPGIQVNPNTQTNSIMWRGWPTALFVDEVSQKAFDPDSLAFGEDANYLLSIPMSDVAMIKVFNPPFIGADGNGPGGAIAVYRKKGRTTNPAKEMKTFTVAGYTPRREFFSPDYSKPLPDSQSDFRRTLYWNPDVYLTKDKRSVVLPFYNNDFTKRKKLVVQGFNEAGQLVSVEKVF